MASLPGPTWFVGCGNMAGAMVEGWRKARVDLSQAIAIRPSGTPVEGLRTVTELPEGTPALALLGIKPQKLDEVAPALAAKVGPETVIVSILAGVEVASLRRRFPAARAIVRAMPNLPVSEGRGVVALYSEDADAFCVRPFGHEGHHQSRVCDGTCDTCDCYDWPQDGGEEEGDENCDGDDLADGYEGARF